MDSAPLNCINCGQPTSTSYCSNCGQKNPSKKINLLTLYTDFQSRIYGFDGMFPRTLSDLTLRPGIVARSFINGNRVKYVGPVGYFFITLTVFLLIISWLGIDFYELAKSSRPINLQGTKGQEEFTKRFVQIIFSNMRIFSFLIVPVTGFWAWLFFRKYQYNWLESMVLSFYVEGHVQWFTIVGSVFFSITGVGINVWQLPIGILLFGIGCVGLYKQDDKVKAFIKGVVVSIISFLTFQLLIIFSATVYVFFHPELLKLLRPSGN